MQRIGFLHLDATLFVCPHFPNSKPLSRTVAFCILWDERWWVVGGIETAPVLCSRSNLRREGRWPRLPYCHTGRAKSGVRVSESRSVLEPLLGFLQRARGGSPPFPWLVFLDWGLAWGTLTQHTRYEMRRNGANGARAEVASRSEAMDARLCGCTYLMRTQLLLPSVSSASVLAAVMFTAYKTCSDEAQSSLDFLFVGAYLLLWLFEDNQTSISWARWC